MGTSPPVVPAQFSAMRRFCQTTGLRRLCQTASVLLPAVVVFLCACSSTASASSPADDERLAFFENRIRPILVEHCYSCHSEEALEAGDLQAGLFVDHRQGLLDGGDGGPAIIGNDPDASPLMAAIRYESYEMPPEGKLSNEILADFETWIESGAFDPRESIGGVNSKPTFDDRQGAAHWSYQPILETGPQSIDDLIQQNLPEHVPYHVVPVDRTTLIRRLSFDLTGLPPTPNQIEDFVNDDRLDATERLVDRYLALPEFGEHWGRHWLDLVRYAESVTLRGLVQHHAYRYRDYVISAINDDLPYDQFLLEQVAGDLLVADSADQALDIERAQRRHIATTFLTLGNNNLEDQDKEKLRMDAVDEQLNVIGSAILGQTIGCARCHDHKFDPIPTSDYYALAGIFRNVQTMVDANVSNWIERPMPMSQKRLDSIASARTEIATLTSEVKRLKALIGPGDDNLKSVPVEQLAGIVLDNTDADLQGHWQASAFNARFVGDSYLHDEARLQGEKSATFSTRLPESGQYEVRLSYSPGENRSREVRVSIQDYVDTHNVTINQTQTPSIDGLFVSLGEYQFSADSDATVSISNFGAAGHVIIDAVQFLPLTQDGSQPSSLKNATSVTNRDAVAKLASLETQLKRLQQSAPEPDMYMAAIEEPEVRDLRIHIRGNVHQYGKEVPRGFLRVVGDFGLVVPPDQSGRLELGQWLGHKSNPLPARVITNRVWLWLFGAGIVRSPDNFGTTGLPPTHPELLDYLSAKLIENEWSLKSIVREIVLSRAYQSCSDDDANATKIDPENRFWLRQNRRRIESESLVDAMLLTGGQLNREMYGKTIPDDLAADYGFDVASNRRSVYWPVLRNSIPDLIRVFDGADPSMVTGKRNNSTVATQALLMMNNDWVLEQSQTAGEHFSNLSFESEPERVEFVFRSIIGRRPSVDEVDLVLDFLREKPSGWPEVIQSLWSTIEFRYRR